MNDFSITLRLDTPLLQSGAESRNIDPSQVLRGHRAAANPEAGLLDLMACLHELHGGDGNYAKIFGSAQPRHASPLWVRYFKTASNGIEGWIPVVTYSGSTSAPLVQQAARTTNTTSPNAFVEIRKANRGTETLSIPGVNKECVSIVEISKANRGTETGLSRTW